MSPSKGSQKINVGSKAFKVKQKQVEASFFSFTGNKIQSSEAERITFKYQHCPSTVE